MEWIAPILREPILCHIDTRNKHLILWLQVVYGKITHDGTHWMSRRVREGWEGRLLRRSLPRSLCSFPLSPGPALVQRGYMPDALRERREPSLNLQLELTGILMRPLLRSSQWLQMHSPHYWLRIEHPQLFSEFLRGGSSTIRESNKEARAIYRCHSDNCIIFWCTWFVRERNYATAHGCTILSWHAGATSKVIEQATRLREMHPECYGLANFYDYSFSLPLWYSSWAEIDS